MCFTQRNILRRGPWFHSVYKAPNLQNRLPLRSLPKKLIVHDPRNVLAVHPLRSYKELHEVDWTNTKDVTHVYNMTLSADGRERIEEQSRRDKEQKVLEREKKRKGLIIQDIDQFEGPFDGSVVPPMTGNLHSPVEPPIFVVHDPPPELKVVEVAHLYIDPGQVKGRGNHSMVLCVELEVPRSLLVPDILCYECVMKDVKKTIIERDGEDGSRKDIKWKMKSGVRREAEGRQPVIWRNAMFPVDEHEVEWYISQPPAPRWSYRRPVRPIRTNVGWQNLERGPYCGHVTKRLHVEKGSEWSNKPPPPAPHPPIARVSLAAKPSKMWDPQLEHEARNYQSFPEYFYEHWSGYNVVGPQDDPVPVGALVPQFYGFYTPEGMVDNEVWDRSSYLSLIMLLLVENCVWQMKKDKMSVDEKYHYSPVFRYLFFNDLLTSLFFCFLLRSECASPFH
ncbi:hypothetical protein AMATHDRAFT_49610 [Amanita thiersii Skay4041]|uniref:Uncharacterized protein n=1 Tax=Amanita thiersii Skay4041 TaxID=703135 RepID=A0A2A9NCJ0_9AGAR|nr:hypothetical protein AMATHDRAFT_49610 [Amanita thiersii Skay4041]